MDARVSSVRLATIYSKLSSFSPLVGRVPANAGRNPGHSRYSTINDIHPIPSLPISPTLLPLLLEYIELPSSSGAWAYVLIISAWYRSGLGADFGHCMGPFIPCDVLMCYVGILFFRRRNEL